MKPMGLLFLALLSGPVFAGQLDCRYLGYNGFRVGYLQATVLPDQSADIPATVEYQQWAKGDNPSVETLNYETLHSQITSMVYIPQQELRYTLMNDEVQEQVVMRFNGELFVGERIIVWEKGEATYDKSIAMCRFK